MNDTNAVMALEDLKNNNVTYSGLINSYNIANERLNNARVFTSRVIEQNKRIIKEGIIAGTNDKYKYSEEYKTITLPSDYSLKSVDNKEQAVDDLFYAYDLANKGIDISKSDDPRIKRLNEKLYVKKYLTNNRGGGNMYDTKINITNDAVKNLIDNSDFDTTVSFVNKEYAIDKATEKYEKGLGINYGHFVAYVTQGNLFDYTTNNQKEYTVYTPDGKEALVSRNDVVIDESNLNIVAGIDELGKVYLKHNVKYKDKDGIVKVALQDSNAINYVIKGLQDEAGMYKIMAEQGDFSAYDQLTTRLNDISKLDTRLRSSIINSAVLDNTIQTVKGLPTITLINPNSANGTPLEHRAQTLIIPKSVAIPIQGVMQQGTISLYKSFNNNTPVYMIGFKTNQGEEFQLPALDNQLNPTNKSQYTDYITAVNQYLIYLYNTVGK